MPVYPCEPGREEVSNKKNHKSSFDGGKKKLEKNLTDNWRKLVKLYETRKNPETERETNSLNYNVVEMWLTNLKLFAPEYKLHSDCYPTLQQFYNPFESFLL